MPAITITDLNNGALDLAHIAEMGTSLNPTCTDRLGQVKQTMSAAGNAIAQTAAGTATAARIAAEAARDAALIQSGVYATEALGRAAVADGVAFKVQGTGDVAAYEYRRTNSGASVLIATYPSSAAFLTIKQDLIRDNMITRYDDGGFYWDNAAAKLKVKRYRTGADTRLAIFVYNGATYTMSGSTGNEKALAPGTANATFFIDSATLTAGEFTVADVQMAQTTETVLSVTSIPLGRLVYGSGLTSNLLKKYEEISQADSIATVIGATKNIIGQGVIFQYDSGGFYWDNGTMRVIRNRSNGDDRLALFTLNGVEYSLHGTHGESRTIAISAANDILYVDPATLTAGEIRLANILSMATPFEENIPAGCITLARLVYGEAVTSRIIKNYADRPLSAEFATLQNTATSVKRLGSGDLFMAGRIPTEKQVFKLVIYGDSIFASGFKDLTFPDVNGLSIYEQPPRSANFSSVQRYIYDYLNFNKPVFRNAMHADWSVTGTSSASVSAVMPNSNAGGVGAATQWEQLRVLNDVSTGNMALITITGQTTAVIVFEAGATGTAAETGTVTLAVSVNGGAFVAPSTVLLGKLSKRGFGATKVYDAALDLFPTAFTLPAGTTVNAYNAYAAMQELFYSGLNPANTYRFRITKSTSEARPVRLWGLYHFTGQTLLVINESKPGMDWAYIGANAWGDLGVSDADFVLIEAPMYHDMYGTVASIKASAKTLINQMLGYGAQVALCSCPPGGVIISGASSTILGDTNGSSYQPGQNFQKYLDGFYNMASTDIPTAGDSPAVGAVYNVTVNSVVYQFVCSNSETPLPTTHTYFTAPLNFPGFTSFPATFTKVSGTGKASIVYASEQHGLTASAHRDAMEAVAAELGIAFVDIYQAFADIAAEMGETIYTDGYSMDAGHPLHATIAALASDTVHYPALVEPFKMNYLSNFFNFGDGHHLANPAHDVIFEAVKNNVLRKSAFKA